MLKFLWMEDPVQGVFSVEFIGTCHINADIRLISTESRPDFSSTLAEGDGRTAIFSQQKGGLAKQAADHLNGKRSSVRWMTVFPKRTFHHPQAIQQAGDEAVLVPCLVRLASIEGFGGTWHGCTEDGAPLMNETRNMDSYFLAIPCHIYLHLSQKPAHFLSP